MLTTVSLRTAAAALCCAVLVSSPHALRAETAAAGTSPAAAATPPAETGAVTPATAPTTPAAPTATAAPAAPATDATAAAQSPATPSDAVANAATPTAPAAPSAPAVPATAVPAAPETPSSTTTTAAPATPPPAATAPAAPAQPAAAATTPPAATTPVAAPAAPEAPASTTATAPAAPPASTTTAVPPAPPADAAATPAAPSTAATAPPAAAPAPSAPEAPAQAAAPAAPAAPVVDPTVLAVRTWLKDGAGLGKASKDDVAAATAFYEARTEGPLWVDKSGFTPKAKSAMDEVRRADEWGLSAAAFDLPALAEAQPAAEALAMAEGKLTLELLKYARFARGGRVNPLSLSRILDMTPPVKDPNVVLAELAAAASPDAYLRDQHPKHAGFQNLRKALLAARGPAQPEVEIDPALKISLPPTKKTLKLGVDAPEVALLRQRLKVATESGASETLFDEKLELAVKAFQVERGIKATGQLSGATRVSLNREVEQHKAPDPERDTQRLVLNMERWRWMPEDLGKVYVQNNIPEFVTRVYKGGEVIFKERIIVGLPAWATPVFSAEMEFVGFNPSWGMPDGIKMRELAPRLQAAGGGDFFSQLFGGGGGGAASIRAHGLKVYRGGREVAPESVNWGSADLRQYSFVQPPGGKNPLGIVKFRYPNKHDVYMHDTIERELFAQSNRALSHGCIRVQNPKQFAAIMLAEGNGLDEAGVQRAIAGGGEIHLDHKIPVHMTYFTVVADEGGKLSTFADIYGHDGKLSSALTGRTLRLDPVIETSSSDTVAYDEAPPAAESGQTKKAKKKKNTYQSPDTLADAISGFWMN